MGKNRCRYFICKAALKKTGCGCDRFIPGMWLMNCANSIPEVMVLTDYEVKSISNITFEIIPQAIELGRGCRS
jgi:hypothetical protein